jgi:hypothetical protein
MEAAVKRQRSVALAVARRSSYRGLMMVLKPLLLGRQTTEELGRMGS